MTTVAGIARNGCVAIAADRTNNVYDRPIICGATKVRRKQTGDGHTVLVAVTGDGALMALVRDALHIEAVPAPQADTQQWADAVAQAITELALERSIRNDDGRMDGTVMLGWNGTLWSLTHMQAIPHPDGIAGLGSGSDYAVGAMTAINSFIPDDDLDLHTVAYRAVQIACRYDRYSEEPVQGEFLTADDSAAEVKQPWQPPEKNVIPLTPNA